MNHITCINCSQSQSKTSTYCLLQGLGTDVHSPGHGKEREGQLVLRV